MGQEWGKDGDFLPTWTLKLAEFPRQSATLFPQESITHNTAPFAAELPDSVWQGLHHSFR